MMIKKNRLSLILIIFLVQLTAVSAADIFSAQNVYEVGDAITVIVYDCPEGITTTANIEDYWAATGTINNGQWSDFFEIPSDFSDTGTTLTINGYCDEEVSTNICVNPDCGEVTENEPPEGVEEPPVPSPPDETPEEEDSSGSSSSGGSTRKSTPKGSGSFGDAIRGSKKEAKKPKKEVINLISPARPSFEKSIKIDPAPIEVEKNNFYLYAIAASIILILITFLFFRWKKHRAEPSAAPITPPPTTPEPQQPTTPTVEATPQPIDPKDIPAATPPEEATPEVQEPPATPEPQQEDDWYVRQ